MDKELKEFLRIEKDDPFIVKVMKVLCRIVYDPVIFRIYLLFCFLAGVLLLYVQTNSGRSFNHYAPDYSYMQSSDDQHTEFTGTCGSDWECEVINGAR